MHTEPLKEHILRFIHLDSVQMEEALSHFTSFSFKKKEIILNPGSICNYDYYISSGALHLSQINTHSGTEEVLSLAISDYWITDLDSFRNRTPSNCTIQAGKDTEVLAISREGFDKACKEIPTLSQKVCK
ncbi:Crp/Fnr family transcriptional regulator [Algoriphagus marincola]|uniref:Crp/Fnr family transcriptional regulator n=1 Tax=Algoriphagus marincola TaxID=264027 RepID=UPI000478B325|nr:cyclic nucleotide-binding domain-containing protein [Algoriphagus marincola]